MKDKTQALVDEVRSSIDRGVFVYGQRLPAAQALADAHGVTYPTAHKAIRKLVDMGYVYRKQGRGTYVARNQEVKTRKIGLVMHTKGHIFGELAHEVMHCLQEANYDFQIIPLSDDNKFSVNVSAALDSLIRSNPYAIVVDECGSALYSGLFEEAGGLGIPIIWNMCSTPPLGQKGHVAGYDRFGAYYQILSHLLQLGHRRIGAYGVQETLGSGNEFIAPADMLKKDYPDIEIIPLAVSGDWDEKRNKQFIRKTLENSGRPTAIMCSIDYRATLVIDVAKEMSLSVPEDLSVTGFYDTPWARGYSLTSVDVRPDEMAKAVVRILDDCNKNGMKNSSQRILTDPDLIIRSSTGQVCQSIDN